MPFMHSDRRLEHVLDYDVAEALEDKAIYVGYWTRF
jgi:hypothetical protein